MLHALKKPGVHNSYFKALTSKLKASVTVL